jgi:D-alanyl-D-alanine carboxypeptidase/D-alanyl-D-alanine-endopeptidase (penicillin-binding protein 4)
VRAVRAVAGVALLAVSAGGGWVALDALDLVPGFLTLAPPPAPAAPFPTAPAAVAAPAVAPVLGDLDPDAPLPDAATLTSWSQSLVADPRLGTSTSVVVSDVLTGEPLVDLGGTTPQVPASTAKVLTALAATSALGLDATLPTTVVQGAPGEVVLVGGGDMMLAPGAGDPTAVDGHAGLGDLARQVADALRAAGTTSVRVTLDDTLFSGPGLHPEWKPGDVNAGYISAIAPLAVDLAKIDPSKEYSPRVPDPARDTATRFATLLAAEGIAVTGDVARAAAPAGAAELGRVESAPIGEVIRLMAHLSENTLAEVLGRLVAVHAGLPGSFTGATKAVLAQVAADGLPVEGVELHDCSGLSAGSRVPARVLVDAMELAADPVHANLRPMLTDLPVAGWLGTLGDRMSAGPAAGMVRAKTGSLPGVTSLAGTIQTLDGRLLAFAVMADETPQGQGGPRAAMDAWAQRLAGCGCSAGTP